MPTKRNCSGHTEHPVHPPAIQTASKALPETDWLFDEIKVPGSELIACCVWEYARESQTLLTATEFRCRREGKGSSFERTPAAMAAIRRVLDLPSDQRAPLYQLLAVFDGRPWRELSPAEKSQYAAMIPREVTPLRPAYLEEAQALVAASQTIPKENIERLRRLGTPESQLVGEGIKRSPFNCVDALRLSGVFGRSPSEDWRQGCSVVALTVDFAHYNDKELSAAFESLLQHSRPPELAKPKRATVFARRKGNQLKKWRVALERLGVARLVKHFGHATKFPDAARQLYHPRIHDRQKRELEQADEFFHKLFPFSGAETMVCRRKATAAAAAPGNPSCLLRQKNPQV
jgi:hypothetical protein